METNTTENSQNEEKMNGEMPISFSSIFSVISNTISDLIHGRSISDEVLKRHWAEIIVIIILCIVYINNRIVCNGQIKEIKRLEVQLTDIRYEALTVSSELLGMGKHSSVEALIEEQGMDLKPATHPPYQLK